MPEDPQDTASVSGLAPIISPETYALEGIGGRGWMGNKLKHAWKYVFKGNKR